MTSAEINLLVQEIGSYDDGHLWNDFLYHWSRQMEGGVKARNAAVVALEQCGVDTYDLEMALQKEIW